MNIEPISSAMTYTAQASPAKAVESNQTKENITVNTDVAVGSENQIDPQTMVIKDIESKSDGSETNGQESNSNTNTNTRQSSQETIRQAVEKMNKKMENAEAVFGIHDKTNRITIKIVDKETKEIIKEFPPDKTLDMIAKAWELAGLMVDEKR